MIIVPHVHYSSMAFLIVCSAICAVAAALLLPLLLRVLGPLLFGNFLRPSNLKKLQIGIERVKRLHSYNSNFLSMSGGRVRASG